MMSFRTAIRRVFYGLRPLVRPKTAAAERKHVRPFCAPRPVAEMILVRPWRRPSPINQLMIYRHWPLRFDYSKIALQVQAKHKAFPRPSSFDLLLYIGGRYLRKEDGQFASGFLERLPLAFGHWPVKGATWDRRMRTHQESMTAPKKLPTPPVPNGEMSIEQSTAEPEKSDTLIQLERKRPLVQKMIRFLSRLGLPGIPEQSLRERVTSRGKLQATTTHKLRQLKTQAMGVTHRLQAAITPDSGKTIQRGPISSEHEAVSPTATEERRVARPESLPAEQKLSGAKTSKIATPKETDLSGPHIMHSTRPSVEGIAQLDEAEPAASTEEYTGHLDSTSLPERQTLSELGVEEPPEDEVGSQSAERRVRARISLRRLSAGFPLIERTVARLRPIHRRSTKERVKRERDVIPRTPLIRSGQNAGVPHPDLATRSMPVRPWDDTEERRPGIGKRKVELTQAEFQGRSTEEDREPRFSSTTFSRKSSLSARFLARIGLRPPVLKAGRPETAGPSVPSTPRMMTREMGASAHDPEEPPERTPGPPSPIEPEQTTGEKTERIAQSKPMGYPVERDGVTSPGRSRISERSSRFRWMAARIRPKEDVRSSPQDKVRKPPKSYEIPEPRLKSPDPGLKPEPSDSTKMPAFRASQAALRALARSSGVFLDFSIRRRFESFFQRELGDVRLHTGGDANRVAEELGAEAVTLGRHVFFASSVHEPQSQNRLGLLGHELTHVVQQSSVDVPLEMGPREQQISPYARPAFHPESGGFPLPPQIRSGAGVPVLMTARVGRTPAPVSTPPPVATARITGVERASPEASVPAMNLDVLAASVYSAIKRRLRIDLERLPQ